MIDLSTQYLGLTLRNPIIIGSSGLTASIEKIQELEQNGAGAIVLYSLYEEQIMNAIDAKRVANIYAPYTNKSVEYYKNEFTFDQYLQLIKEAKSKISIPVIASINCVSPREWVSYVKKIRDAGADALELNMYIVPNDVKYNVEEVEKIYFELIKKLSTHITLPTALKIPHYFTSLANMMLNLSKANIAGLVLFNRFLMQDVDIANESIVTSHKYSSPQDHLLLIKWIYQLADKVECDLAAATGIHDSAAIIKALLVGAKATQIVSAIYKNGPDYIQTMIKGIKDWMTEHKYHSLHDFIGKLHLDKIKKPMIYERMEFIQQFSKQKNS